MVEISKKYKIGSRRFGLINWIGTWTLYKKEVLRFLAVWMQTIFSPIITSGLIRFVTRVNSRNNVFLGSFIFLCPPDEND